MAKIKELFEALTQADKSPEKSFDPSVSATLTVAGSLVRYVSPEGQTYEVPLADLLALARPRRMDTLGVVLPQSVRLIYSEGPRTVWVCEVAPGRRAVRWINDDSPVPFGRGATYSQRMIALPYVIVLAAFEGDVLTDYNEAFFRTAPLASEDDPLFYPALLNCSKFEPQDGHPLAWICTQKLDRKPIVREQDSASRMRGGLSLLSGCLFDAGFNWSSEHHEFSSWYSASRQQDPRIGTIGAWETASMENELFALDVKFLPVEMSVKQVVHRLFDNLKRAPAITTSNDLLPFMMRKRTAPRRRPR